MRVLKVLKDSKGNTLINVLIGASLLAGGAILVSQGVVSTRKNAIQLNKSSSGQIAAKNIMDLMKTKDNASRTGNVNYYPSNHPFTAVDGSIGSVVDHDPKDALSGYNYSLVSPATNTDPLTTYGVEHAGARYYFAPVWRQDTSALVSSTDWVFDGASPGSFDNEVLDGSVTDFRVSSGLNLEMTAAGVCGTTNLTAACENQYNNDANIVMANSVHTWQSMEAIISRLAYFYNEYPDFCTQTKGLQIIANSNYHTGVDSWIDTTKTVRADTLDFFQEIFASDLIDVPSAQEDSLNVWLKLEKEDLLSNNKTTSCSTDFEALPPGTQANTGNLTSSGLRVTIHVEYAEVDADGNTQTKIAIFNNSFSQSRLSLVPEVLADPIVSALPYDAADPYSPVTSIDPTSTNEYCGEVREGSGDTGSAPTIEVEANMRAVAGVPFCRLEYMRPNYGESFHNGVQLVDLAQPDAAAINSAIQWAMGYRDSGWFLCTMPPRTFGAGFDPEILDITDPFGNSTNSDGKKGLRRMQADGDYSVVRFENIRTTLDETNQNLKMRIKGLSEGEYKFSVKIVDASRSVSEARSSTWKVDLLRPFAITRNIRTVQNSAGRYLVGEFGQALVGSLHINGDSDPSNDWVQQLPGNGTRPNEIALLNTLNANFGQSADGETGELYQCGGGTPAFEPPDQADYSHLYNVFGGGVKWYFGPSRPVDEIYKDGSGDTIEDYFETGTIPGPPDSRELLLTDCNLDSSTVIGPMIDAIAANSGEYMVAMQLCDLCGDGAPNQMGFRYWIADFTPQSSTDFTVEVNNGNTALSSNTFNMYQSGVSPLFEYGIRVQKPQHQVGRYAGTRPLPMAAVCEVASSDAPFDIVTTSNKDNYTYVTDRFHTNYVIDPVTPTDLYGNPNWVIDPDNEYPTHSFTCSQPNLSNSCREDSAAPITGVIAGAAIDACGRFRPDNPPEDKPSVDLSTEVNTYMVRGYSGGNGSGRNDRCNQVDCVPGYYCDQVGSVGGGSNVPGDAAGVCRAQDEIIWDRTNSYGGPGTAGGALRRTTMAFLGGAPPSAPECGVYSGTDFIGADCACGWNRDCNNNITGLGSCSSANLKCTNGGVDCSSSEAAAAACLILGSIGGVGISESDISGRPNYINTSTSVTAYAPLMSGNTLNPAACLPDSNYRGYVAYQTEYAGAGIPAITYAEGVGAGESANYDTNGGRCTWEKGTGASCGWQETRDNEHLRHQTNGHEWCIAGTNVYGDWEWTTFSSTDHATCVSAVADAYTDSSCLTDVGSACRDLELKPGQTDFNIGDIRNCNNGTTPASPTGTVAWVIKDGPYTCDGDWSNTGSTSCGSTWEYTTTSSCTGTWVAGTTTSCGGPSTHAWSLTGNRVIGKAQCELGTAHPAHCSNASSTCSTAGDLGNECYNGLPGNCLVNNTVPEYTCSVGGGGTCPADTCSSLGSPCTIGDTCDDISGTDQTPYSCNDTSSCGSAPSGDIQGDSCSPVGSTTSRFNGTTVQNYVCGCGAAGSEDCENISSGYTDPTSPQVGCTQDTFGKTCSRTDADTTYSYQCTGCDFTGTYAQDLTGGTDDFPVGHVYTNANSTMPSCSSTLDCSTLDDGGADGSQNSRFCFDSSTNRIHYQECEIQSCSVPALECNYNETSPNPWTDDSNNVNIDFAGSCIATQGSCDNLPTNAASGQGLDNSFCPNLNPFGVDSCLTCADVSANFCSGESFSTPDGCGGTLSCTGSSTVPMECFGDSSNLPKTSCTGAPGNVCVPFTACGTSVPMLCEAKVACASDELYYANQSDCNSVHGAANCTEITAYNLDGGYCGRGCPGGTTFSSESSCENSELPNFDLQCLETRPGSGDWCPAGCPTSTDFTTDPDGYSSLSSCEDGGTYSCASRSFLNSRNSSLVGTTTTQNTTNYPLRTLGTSNPVSIQGLTGSVYQAVSPYCRIADTSAPSLCGPGETEFFDWSDCISTTSDPARCSAIVSSGTCQDKSGCSGTTYARDDLSCSGSTPSVGDSVNNSCCSGSGSCYYMGPYSYDRHDNATEETEQLFCTSAVSAPSTPSTPATCSGSMGWDSPGSTEAMDCTSASGGPYPNCLTNTACGVENEGDYRCEAFGSGCRIRECQCSGTYTPAVPGAKEWTTGKCADVPEAFRPAGNTGTGASCFEATDPDKCYGRSYSGGFPSNCTVVTDDFEVIYSDDGLESNCSGDWTAGEWGSCSRYDMPNSDSSCQPTPDDSFDAIEVYCTPDGSAPSGPPTTCTEYWCQGSSGGGNNPPSAFSYDIFLGGSDTKLNGNLHVNITSPPTDADGDTLTYTYYFRAGCEDDVATFAYVTSTGTPGPTTYEFSTSGTTTIDRTQCELGPAHPSHCGNSATVCSDSSDVGGTCYNFCDSLGPCGIPYTCLGSNTVQEFTCGETASNFTGDGVITSTSTCLQNQWTISTSDFNARCSAADVAEYIVAVSVTDGTDTVWGTSGGVNFASRSFDTLSANNSAHMCSGSTYYRVNCGGSNVVTSGPDTSGTQCGSPHGDTCTAAQNGDSFGSITCSEVALEYGVPAINHGQTRTESCECSPCSYSSYVNGDYTDDVTYDACRNP